MKAQARGLTWTVSLKDVYPHVPPICSHGCKYPGHPGGLKGSSWAPYSESFFLMGLQVRG